MSSIGAYFIELIKLNFNVIIVSMCSIVFGVFVSVFLFPNTFLFNEENTWRAHLLYRYYLNERKRKQKWSSLSSSSRILVAKPFFMYFSDCFPSNLPKKYWEWCAPRPINSNRRLCFENKCIWCFVHIIIVNNISSMACKRIRPNSRLIYVQRKATNAFTKTVCLKECIFVVTVPHFAWLCCCYARFPYTFWFVLLFLFITLVFVRLCLVYDPSIVLFLHKHISVLATSVFILEE